MRGCRLLAVALMLSGCASTGAEEELRFTAASSYGRHAAVQGKVDLYVANRGRAPLVIESYQVRHPMFELLDPVPRRSELPPDSLERIVPVPFGAPRCDVTSADGAELAVRVRDGSRTREVVVPLPDRAPGLVRAHRLVCSARAVEAVARASLGPRWEAQSTAAGPQVRTTLRLDRVGPGEVVVTEMLGSILLSVDSAQSPVLTLPPGDAAAEVEVVITAPRCDQHALIESKTSFTFGYFASVDGGEPARLSVTADDAGRVALQALLDDSCRESG